MSPDEKMNNPYKMSQNPKKFVRRVYGAEEFINSKEILLMAERYFSKRIKQVADDKKRVQRVREFRLKSTKAVTVKVRIHQHCFNKLDSQMNHI